MTHSQMRYVTCKTCINCVQAFNAFGFGDAGFQMSFGIGAFPFGLFASVFNVNDGRPPARMYQKN